MRSSARNRARRLGEAAAFRMRPACPFTAPTLRKAWRAGVTRGQGAALRRAFAPILDVMRQIGESFEAAARAVVGWRFWIAPPGA